MAQGPQGMAPLLARNQAQAGAQSQSGSTDPLSMGAAYYMLGTVASNNTAFLTVTGFGTPTQSTTETDFSSSFTSAASFWLNYNFGPVGIRGRFFFEAEHQPAELVSVPSGSSSFVTASPDLLQLLPGTSFGAPGTLLTNGFGTDSLSFQRSLNIHVVDLEATFQQKLGTMQLLLSAGGRYLDLSQALTASLNNTVTAGVLSESQFLTNSRRFYGGGGTAACEVQAPLLAILSGYAVVRGSVVIGGQQENLNFAGSIVDTGGSVGGSQTLSNSATSAHTAVMPILECELGLQIGQSLGGFPISIRAGVVSQTYFNAGSASSQNGNLNLVGGVISLTLTY
jgi:hypothetical protein